MRRTVLLVTLTTSLILSGCDSAQETIRLDIRGRVTSTSGDPIEGARVTLAIVGGLGGMTNLAFTMTGVDGAYFIDYAETDPCGDWGYGLNARAQGYRFRWHPSLPERPGRPPVQCIETTQTFDFELEPIP